jgi:glycine oxidase
MRKSEDRWADVAVVGGGVAGLAAARELATRGLNDVVVFDDEATFACASNAAAGMLAPQAEADRADELFELLCASRDMYPDFAASLREESGVDIELDTTGTLYLAFTEEDEREVRARFEWQTRAGLEVESLTPEEARALEPQISPDVRAVLRFPRDWQVENRMLVRALRESATSYGAYVLSDRKVEGVRVVGGRVVGVETSKGLTRAHAVVLAAGAWSSRVPLVVSEHESGHRRAETESHPSVEPVRGQMLSFRRPRGPEPFARHVVYSPRGYVVPRRDGRLLAGSTTERAGFDASVTEAGVRTIKKNAVEIAPGLASLALEESWAGLRPRADDGLPVLGESSGVKNLFYATGHYRNGILLAPATGEIIADLLTGGTTRWPPRALEAFSPARFRRALAGSHGN